MIDATLTTPVLLKPFDHGADVVVHSLAKFIGGHGVAIGGCVIDAGRFDWERSGRFPLLTEPDAGLHGIDFAEEFGPSAYITRARLEGLRDFGAVLSPMIAFQFLQGLETLPLRMQRHVANARAIAEFLATQEAVERVTFPGLPGHEDYALTQRLLPHGPGAVFSFELKGGRSAGRKFIESLQVFSTSRTSATPSRSSYTRRAPRTRVSMPRRWRAPEFPRVSSGFPSDWKIRKT